MVSGDPGTGGVHGSRSAGRIDAERALEVLPDFVLGLRTDGTITYANPGVTPLLGWEPHEIVGRSFLDVLHPDDVDRAANVLQVSTSHSAPPDAGLYRLVDRRGDWVDVSVVGEELDYEHFVVSVRQSDNVPHLTARLEQILAGEPVGDVLGPVLDLIGWRKYLYVCVLCWEPEPGRRRLVGDAVPPSLAGGDRDSSSPWAAVRRDRQPVVVEAADLDQHLRDQAGASGLHRGWILPVADPARDEPALLTTWTQADGLDLSVVEPSVQLAARLAEMALTWAAVQGERASG